MHEVRGQLLLYVRSKELAFFTFLLPLIMFVLLGRIYDMAASLEQCHRLAEEPRGALRLPLSRSHATQSGEIPGDHVLGGESACQRQAFFQERSRPHVVPLVLRQVGLIMVH